VPPPRAAALDDFQRLVESAEDAGITVAIENTHAPAHLDALFERFHSPALGLCFDIAHDRLHSETPLILLRRWRNRLAVMHVSDTDGRRDWHWLPGDGNADIEAVGACLAGPPGMCLMLEAMLRSDEPGHEFAVRAYDAARRVRDALHAGSRNAAYVH
jgi:sugar phosphate isomerase/epimerase